MHSEPGEPLAAIVLCGGRSSRMGTSKALLDWHGVPLVAHLCALLMRVARPVVVVHAFGQRLPQLPAGTEPAVDAHPGQGPLEGMASGLRTVADRAGIVFLGAVDLPFLHPGFIRGLADRLAGAEAAVPVSDGRDQPLAAVYRAAVLDYVERRLRDGRMTMNGLLDDLDVRRVPAPELPHPESLRNVNSPADLQAALAEPPPLVRVITPGGRERTVRAATVAAALRSAGLDGAMGVVLNGGPVRSPEPGIPLVDGDTLELGT